MATRILMIEDDARLASMVSEDLGRNGFDVSVARMASEGLARLAREPFDLVLLDLMLPDADGLDVCRRLRASGGAVPVIMLTAKGDPTDRVVGLELGADDYLAKPFDPRELLARIRAVLRRPSSVAGAEFRVLRFGRLEVDADARVARVDGIERPMTAHQFNLLLAMAERAGRVLSREQLMEAVKGESLEAFDRSIDVHVARIRAAIEDDPKSPRRILTVRGAGYVFARSQDA
ncbi:MAG: response regulator transcription factor [Holophagales bacterium]|nr:response regulator transcription factor [Holophagales bacterium]